MKYVGKLGTEVIVDEPRKFERSTVPQKARVNYPTNNSNVAPVQTEKTENVQKNEDITTKAETSGTVVSFMHIGSF